MKKNFFYFVLLFFFFLLTGKRERSWEFKNKLEGELGDPAQNEDLLPCLTAQEQSLELCLRPRAESLSSFRGLWQGPLHLGVSLDCGDFSPQLRGKAEF